MHIAFLTPEYPDFSDTGTGGLGTSIKNLAESLVDNGITVSIFIYGQGSNKRFVNKGINFHLIRQIKYKFLGWLLYRKHLGKYINNIIKEERIDLVEAPDWTGITAFMQINCPLVIRLNGSDGYFCYLENRKQKFKNYILERLALKSANQLVSVSSFTAKTTKEIFKLKKNITVIPNSIDVKEFFPRKRTIKKDQLLYFGSLIRKKGVLELASIFNLIKSEKSEIRLFLVGKDVIDISTNKSTLQLFLNKLEAGNIKDVVHIPEVTYLQVKDYIAESEVILLPSFAEALPMTWLEGMSMEKALVTSDIGWAKEIMINGETGFTVNPLDHLVYAEKVIHLINNPLVAEKMGKAARRHILRTFSTNVVTKNNIDFYRRVCNTV